MMLVYCPLNGFILAVVGMRYIRGMSGLVSSIVFHGRMLRCLPMQLPVRVAKVDTISLLTDASQAIK